MPASRARCVFNVINVSVGVVNRAQEICRLAHDGNLILHGPSQQLKIEERCAVDSCVKDDQKAQNDTGERMDDGLKDDG